VGHKSLMKLFYIPLIGVEKSELHRIDLRKSAELKSPSGPDRLAACRKSPQGAARSRVRERKTYQVIGFVQRVSVRHECRQSCIQYFSAAFKS
jgi:hypothetical protein